MPRFINIPGRTLAYTDAAGTTHANSFWCVARADFDVLNESLTLVFVGFKDAASFASGAAPLAGAVKRHVITGSDFREMLVDVSGQATAISALLSGQFWGIAFADSNSTGTSAFFGASSAASVETLANAPTPEQQSIARAENNANFSLG